MTKRRKYSEDLDTERETFKIQEPVTYGTPLHKCKLDVKFKNQNQKKFVTLLEDNVITICSGRPGTGKTFLACYDAISRLKKGEITKIVLVKSVTTLQGEEIGFLKGTMEEKMDPFVFSFKQNFYELIGNALTDQLFAAKTIEVIPIAYMRGITIKNAVILVDEVQNVTKKNIRSILSRLGEGSRMVLIGDENQIDIKDARQSALTWLVDKLLGRVVGVGAMRFEKGDVVRHPIIGAIEDVFDEEDAK